MNIWNLSNKIVYWPILAVNSEDALHVRASFFIIRSCISSPLPKDMTIVGSLDDICHYEFNAFQYILNNGVASVI